jgi:hypothetical protein
MNFTCVLRALNIPYIILGHCFASSRVGTYRIQRYSAGCYITVFLIGGLFWFPAFAVAQSNDEFIGAIAKIKTAVAAVACFNPSQGISVHGTAFFVQDDGTFVTAGHVVKEFLPSGALSGCNQVGVYVPIDMWQRDQLNARLLIFLPNKCSFDGVVDVAKCRTIDNPTSDNNIHVKPVSVLWMKRPSQMEPPLLSLDFL